MCRYRIWATGIWLTLAIGFGAGQAYGQTPIAGSRGDDQVARIGVLVFRGVAAAKSHWRPLANYLTQSVPRWRFELVPVTLVTAPQQIENKKIDFIITNPGHYVTLAERFGLSALSTRERAIRDDGKGLLQYGSVILTRKDAKIRGLGELRGRKLGAVSPDAFGGFQIIWYELQVQGIDAFKDLGSIRYMGFPQDAIVTAVLDGEVDAGVVRSGLIELLSDEGRLDMGKIHVLNANMQLGYPHQISSRLYPEWPFASLPGIPKYLRENVLRALLNTQTQEVSEKFGLKDIWSAPLAYTEVRALVAAYQERRGGQPNTLAVAIVSLTAAVSLSLLLGYALLRRRRAPIEAASFSGAPDGRDPELDDALGRFETLTMREREVLALICSGCQTKDIAGQLHISPKTVEYHRANLLLKTEAGTTNRLVHLATRLGLDQGFSPG